MNAPNPYCKTKVNWGKSQAQIVDLLEKFGVRNSQLTNLEGIGKGLDRIVLQFTYRLDTEKQGEVVIPCRITVEIPSDSTRNQMYRALYWYLKTKLEAVIFGFREFEEEFLSYIVDPKSKQTLFERVAPSLGENLLKGQSIVKGFLEA